MIQSVTGTSNLGSRHVPLRRCLYCRQSLPKGRADSGLIRLASDESGYRLDLERRLGGRGAWLCRDCAASLVAGNEKDKQVRRAFGAQADAMRDLLRQALAADPARRVDHTGQMDGGADVG